MHYIIGVIMSNNQSRAVFLDRAPAGQSGIVRPEESVTTSMERICLEETGWALSWQGAKESTTRRNSGDIHTTMAITVDFDALEWRSGVKAFDVGEILKKGEIVGPWPVGV